MDNITFIIQARFGSHRMRGKILTPFYGGKSILELLLEKLKEIENSDIIIATSLSEDNDSIEDLCLQKNVKCYRGSENDVLSRFIEAADKYNVKHIVRICSDNPFLELNSIKELIGAAKAHPEADYISFKIGEKPSIQTHYGFWCEYVTLDTLKKVAELTNEDLYHEHVTNYIYSHQEKGFDIKWLPTSQMLLDNPNIRLTIDTPADFKTAVKVYEHLTQVNKYPTICEVVEYLKNTPEYVDSMKNEIINNTK